MSESEKVGRTLSAATRKKIQAAMDALHELMGGGQPDIEPDEEDDEGKAIGRREDVSQADRERAQAEYGNVQYADEKNKKYPIDTEEHIRAAWNYIGQERNAAKYTAAEVAAIKGRIVAAWKKKIDPDGPPSIRKDAEDLLCVKALGAGRVGAYAVLWGDAGRRDLTNEYFTPETGELTALFKAVGKLPLLYHHAGDESVKTAVVGVVDILEPDDVGLWYEAQREKSHAYRGAIDKLIADGALGTSTGTLPRARQVKDGQITRWPIAEISLTPTPAEPRMMDRPVSEIKAAYKAIGLDFPEEPDARGDEESRQKEIEMERERLALLEFEMKL